MKNILSTLVDGQDLDQQTIKAFFEQMLKGETDPILLASVLTALKIKGETPEEISGAAIAIKAAATKFPPQKNTVADCVGTGGDGANTINISTTAAI